MGKNKTPMPERREASRTLRESTRRKTYVSTTRKGSNFKEGAYRAEERNGLGVRTAMA